MNIHLVEDEKFINKSFETFEKYYPGENVFFVNTSNGIESEMKHVEKRDGVLPISFLSRSSVEKVVKFADESTNLFVHYLNPVKAYFALELEKRLSLDIYWVFYGGELYSLLNRKGEYELYDYNIPVSKSKTAFLKRIFKSLYERFKMRESSLDHLKEKFIDKADFFCFWNYYDYKLLKKHYPSNIKFKYFRYFESPVSRAFDAPREKKKGHILVNHSASRHGNHLTILQTLKDMDSKKDLEEICVPLGYGSDKVKNSVVSYGRKKLEYCFNPILDFVPQDEYFNNLNSVSTAIFGHRRQQAGNNIYYLLAAGAKLFLRNDNNLLRYLRDNGYVVFEYEKNLNSIDDLLPLGREEQVINKELVMREFSQERIDKAYKELIEK